MFVTRLRLEGYKRCSMAAQVLEIRPHSPLQIILGTNGSGKSSVLAEMSPLPGKPSDFSKGGIKEFDCTHRGSNYQLVSRYSGGSGKHSFIKDDGEELNKGGTLQIQKDLVFQEFGLNKDRLDLLLGLTRFTDMSVAQRREWLTLLSPVDLTYAFSQLKQVKTVKRDTDGVVKHTAQRINRESQDFPSEHERTALRKRVETLTTTLNTLFQNSQGGEAATLDITQFETTLKTLCEALHRVLGQYPRLPPSLQVKTQQEASEAVLVLDQQVKQLQERLQEKQSRYMELERQRPDTSVTFTPEDVKTLESQVGELQKRLSELPEPTGTEHFPLIDLSGDPEAQTYFTTVMGEWEALLLAFPDNRDRKFTRESLHAADQKLKQLQQAITKREDRLVTIHHRLQTLKACEAIHCPECKHQFRPGVDPNEVTTVQREQEGLRESLIPLQKEVETLREFMEAGQEYLDYRRRFQQLGRQHPRLVDFFSVWVTQGLLHTPRDYQSEYSRWRSQMLLAIKRGVLNRDLTQHQSQLALAKDTERFQNHQLQDQLKSLQKEIQELTGSVRKRQQELSQTRRAVEVGVTYTTELKRAIESLESFLGSVPKLLEYDLERLIKERVREVQLQLAQAQETLSKSDVREGVLRDLESQHQEVLRDQSDYGVLLKALSPNGGLIGRYLLGFMQVVAQFLNSVIAKVWTYPLEILPSKIDREELDYRFPLNVNQETVMAPDIELGSSGHRDIINFAFRLLAMRFLGLEDFPLYLDEVGNMFDEEHRIRLVRLIENMLETQHVSQVFFISHYITTHGALEKAADVCVIDDTNITVPVVYNEHVTIE